ncbi:site-specific integrase [Thalassotalea hakodatensis]|uniref:site-specific integrase n=1 Tax=Thalassotalea hakodatensis TaxID=3030492 RepID=UPI0025739947|nr:site-specific integrase [Thalassotalea hakodatensis]
MKSANIPHLYIRNGIYYYRNNTIWKSLRTRCKKTAFRKLSTTLFGTPPAIKDTSITVNDSSSTPPDTQPASNHNTSTMSLIKAYLAENGDRWCEREYTRIKNALSFLPKGEITREIAIELKAVILLTKTVTTFNRYLKYFNALYRWGMANNVSISENPFEGLRVIEKKKSISDGRKAYSSKQLRTLMSFAEQYDRSDRRYWLIMIGRYTGARMNEICQLKPCDVTAEAIHIRGEVLKSANARRAIPIHPKLIELGLLDWVADCKADRLFHEWQPVRGSHSHAASRWFSRNNPFKSVIKGQKAEVDFHSLRHTVATELKRAGVARQYAAQILGHYNGSITYDRYGKNIDKCYLKESVAIIGEFN